MENSIDSTSSQSSTYNEVYQDFRRQALDFYGTQKEIEGLSHDVEKCLKKKANAFVNREQKKLFLFPCMNDLSNIPDDDCEESTLSQKSFGSFLDGKLPFNFSRRCSDAISPSEIKDLSSIICKQQNLCNKNKDSY